MALIDLRARAWGRVEALRSEKYGVLNHPGHPDQRSHGRKGGSTREERVAEVGASPLVSSRALGGGLSGASTTLEVHEGGTVVRKEYSDQRGGGHDKKQADAEELGAKVGQAIGVEVPAVARVGQAEVLMEHVSAARTGAEMSRAELSRLADSEQGRLIGLHDVIVANADRNPGNVMQRDDGSIVAIDHAYAFGNWSAGVGSPFAGHLLNDSGSDWADDIGISRERMSAIGDRLRSLESDFRAAGREDWFGQVMERYDMLAPRAH